MFERSYSIKRIQFGSRIFCPFFFGNLFFLFIFFLIFLPKAMKPCGFSVSLARVVSCEPVTGQGCIVSVLKDNTLYLDDQMVSLSELKSSLDQRHRDLSSVLIKADQRANVGTLVKVWDMFRALGVERVNIATNE